MISEPLALSLLYKFQKNRPMKLMRFALLGAAVAGGVYYFLNNKKGNVMLDDIAGTAGGLAGKARDLAVEYIDKLAAGMRS